MLGEILIPPSPNWFINDALDCRSEDSLLVTAAFRFIVVYQVAQEERLPKVLKVIPYTGERVQALRLYWSVSDPDYGHTVACISDTAAVRLVNLHTGDFIAVHHEHQNLNATSICWGTVGGKAVVVTVGSNSRMVLWQARHGVTRIITLNQLSELSVVETNPQDRSQALVAAEKNIALVSLKDGEILTMLKGHDYEVYCVRWYIGNGNPLQLDSHPVNSRAESLREANKGSDNHGREKVVKGSDSENWRSSGKSSSSAGNGPFFVSSDYGRNIFLWDVSAKRYVSRANVPHSTGGHRKQVPGKDKNQGKQHISLAWHNGDLLSSSIRGELLHWTLFPGGSKFKSLHHLHNRAIYNLVILGETAITSGLDRFLQGFHLLNQTHLFQMPTLGAPATTLSFCPHDVNRLAIGSQENNIRLLNFGSQCPVQTQTVWQNIKGKILSLSWHPAQEGRLLFGTGSGQVGWTDVSSSRVVSFAYYHQKSVYKVEWGPSVCPEKTGFSDAWCAYSFGDREMVIRTLSDPMADPVHLHTLIEESEEKNDSSSSKFPKDITEFSFSPDYNFLAIGSHDGQVRVYRRIDMELIVTLVVVKKAVQHLLWQPPSDSNLLYVLAVGSNENKIYIFHLDKFCNGEETAHVVTQATQELCGHESRVVWMTWSPHKDDILASASYDHTVQLWNTSTGEPIVNYGGHATRVFRVEFSPCDPDLVYSFGEENSVHTWHPSQLTCKTASESSACLKRFHPRKGKEKEPPKGSDEATVKLDIEVASSEKKADVGNSNNGSIGTGLASSASSKKPSFKSFFPKLHTVSSRKKGFHQLVLINLLEKSKVDEQSSIHTDGKSQVDDDDDLEEDLDEEDMSTSKDDIEENILSSISGTCEKFQFILEKDTKMADPEEFLYVMNMYGKPQQMDTLLAAEIEHHEAQKNIGQAGLMHCWRGSLDDHIRAAAIHKKLTPFLVASAPQVSVKLWEFATEAYAEQLIDEGDDVTAASYLVNINKVEEAISLLLKHRHFREALVIAKCRLGYNQELQEKVVNAWASSAIYEGSFDLAATLHVSIGRTEQAARTLSRRNDPGSLFVSAMLYQSVGNEDLAHSTGSLALKEASVRHDLDKIEPILSYFPKLHWFQTISCCHSTILNLLEQVTAETSCSYLTKRRQKLVNEDCQVEPSENISNETTGTEDENKVAPVDSRNVLNSTEPEGFASVWLPLLERVEAEWLRHGITQEQYPHLYESVTYNFSTQQMPSSVKQLWFLVSVALSEFLLSTSQETWVQHLAAALSYTVSWGKPDQILHLTHALLPRGVHDLTTLGKEVGSLEEDKSLSSCIGQLCYLYQASEISTLHSYLQTDEYWSKLKENSAKTLHDVDDRVVDSEDLCSESAEVDKSGIETQLADMTLTDSHEKQKDLEEHGRSVSGKGYGLPQSNSELITTLNFYLDNLSISTVPVEGQVGNISGLDSPRKLLQEIVLKLHERDDFKEDVRTLLCRIPSLA